ncbi:MAG TPA: F0F1 ATP synthase subunit gamma [Zoogloea sp.]|uniref:F0F1 ATP synthase subunit gamma n=1 Tax=Zoogloea sp. TaxID=49181 RepID=UPI002BA104F3|nr:F0F1 ATP synthase subunit gamma [Zoogloea sp.]HOB45301.1 F0F1 ATP synthase subunit gamma [Zoogloea sp.]HQA09332.1 F0F1 ATP synthase subunit gamma [Zoogloea sp.]HQE38023.1 F0F1 ATP synthase subunit gamma [Zoogloea sp.]
MSATAASLRRKIATAGDLESVVRTMKAMAASSIGQYENAVRALDDYDRTVQLGLLACFRQPLPTTLRPRKHANDETIGAVVFGSDQGLVGQFNDHLGDFVVETLAKLPGRKVVWSVGERIQVRLAGSDLDVGVQFPLPNSIGAITTLVGQVLQEVENRRAAGEIGQVYLFHNRPRSGAIYEPVSQRLLPLDDAWQKEISARSWPSRNLPEIMPGGEQTLFAFVREYLFVSLFRACAESLASENASRLTAMQRAEKNIDELLENLDSDFHRLRQSAIDEELFDVVSGFEAYGR